MPKEAGPNAWPALELREWLATRDTLHMWLQIIGKVRLVQTPWINHSWHATFYLTSRGLTTSPIPFGDREFQVDLDFIDHRLAITSTDGRRGGFDLEPQTVSAFYHRFMTELDRLDLPVRIVDRPNEVPDPIPFPADDVHRDYDPDAVNRFWRMLVQAERVMRRFRARFLGKCSPIHLFWGAMDLAVTRFSGRTAPPHPGGIPNLPDHVTREAYSHEVCSCGFWAGTPPIDYPAFYAYAYPEPPGFAGARVVPDGAFYSPDFREFVLPYSRVRESSTPDQTLLEFLQSTYEAAADLGQWDRGALERRPRD
ncbi:MAG: hypothetical protein KJ061_19570 [Vicinamibacteraceae bacterium]|nr:hypothetical protein [Vicinamibacteraceae bacterium]